MVIHISPSSAHSLQFNNKPMIPLERCCSDECVNICFQSVQKWRCRTMKCEMWKLYWCSGNTYNKKQQRNTRLQLRCSVHSIDVQCENEENTHFNEAVFMYSVVVILFRILFNGDVVCCCVSEWVILYYFVCVSLNGFDCVVLTLWEMLRIISSLSLISECVFF